MNKKVMILGSGELGKELVISLQQLGIYTIAVDNYPHAPAMQVAHESEVIDMLSATELDRIVSLHQPDIIVPEIEAIRTEQLYRYENEGIQVVPSAKAVNFTMNRKSIRDLAAQELGLRTANYLYADSLVEFRKAVEAIGIPCVVKPLMSSSGKGQSIIRETAQVDQAWSYAIEGSRGDIQEVIVEEFIHFQSEITLLTVTQKNGPTLYCPPIGHRQEKGDYRESWQPAIISEANLEEARHMAGRITDALGGVGIWGIEFFIADTGVYFSELSPRPHDTGMVTLGQTQNINQFELHARAILHYPIPMIKLITPGCSSVILAEKESSNFAFRGIEKVLSVPSTSIRIFGKPTTRPFRRMGVVLFNGQLDTEDMIEETKHLASEIQIEYLD